MKTAAQYCLLSMAVMISFRNLSEAEAHDQLRNQIEKWIRYGGI
jgi:hypothetical protein